LGAFLLVEWKNKRIAKGDDSGLEKEEKVA